MRLPFTLLHTSSAHGMAFLDGFSMHYLLALVHCSHTGRSDCRSQDLTPFQTRLSCCSKRTHHCMSMP